MKSPHSAKVVFGLVEDTRSGHESQISYEGKPYWCPTLALYDTDYTEDQFDKWCAAWGVQSEDDIEEEKEEKE